MSRPAERYFTIVGPLLLLAASTAYHYVPERNYRVSHFLDYIAHASLLIGCGVELADWTNANKLTLTVNEFRARFLAVAALGGMGGAAALRLSDVEYQRRMNEH